MGRDVYRVITDDMARIADDDLQRHTKGSIWIRRALEMEASPWHLKSPENVFFRAVFQTAVPGARVKLLFKAPPDYPLGLDNYTAGRRLEWILSTRARTYQEDWADEL